jgi:hypothetical protein
LEILSDLSSSVGFAMFREYDNFSSEVLTIDPTEVVNEVRFCDDELRVSRRSFLRP